MKISSVAKNLLSSVAAASGPSEAWQTLIIMFSPRSPRMVPAGASCELVGPSRSRTMVMAFSPSRASAMTGVLCMNSTISGKKGLSATCA